MTFIKNTSLLSFFLTSFLLSGSSMAMKEEDFNQKSIVTHQKTLPIGVPVGSIIAFAGDKEPSGWLMCDGLQYSSKKYPKLYEIIKTKYVPKEIRLNILDHNENNENKLFCVPDLRGRVLIGVDNGSNRVTSNNTLGSTGGEEKHQLTIEEMPKHNHKMSDSSLGSTTSPFSAVVAGKNLGNLNGFGITEETGNDQSHNNMQPYLVSNYIIKAKQDEIVHEEKEIKLFKPLPLKPLKTSESLPTQKEFENNMAISEKTLILYKQIFSLSEMVNDLQQQINPLIQKNEILNREICELQEKTKPFKPLKAVLKNNPLENSVIDSWTSYDQENAGAWKPMRFDAFEGDESMKVEGLSAIKIPENGVYSLFAHYCWHSIAKNNEGKTATYTSISINEPSEGFRSYHFAQHHLVDNYVANDCLNRATHLNKGDRVMLSIKEHPNTEYSRDKFQLKVDRIY